MKTPIILIISKSVDGGTGTYVESLYRLENRKKYLLKSLVLEKPSFRITNINHLFFAKKSYYPQTYTFSLKNFISFIKEIIWSKKHIQKIHPDIFLGVDIHANILLTINKLLFFKKTPIVLTTHSGISDTLSEKSSRFLSNILKLVLKFLYNKADFNVCVSRKVSSNLQSTIHLTKKPVVVFNGIKKVKSLNITPLNPKRPVFINVSRMTKQKDHETLLLAFSKVTQKIPESKLLIVGSGPKHNEIKSLASSIVGGTQIEFAGWTNNTRRLLKGANIFILSSKREGFPFTLLEAMSSSKAIISTNSPYGPDEILDNGRYGLLVKIKDTNALAKAMLSLAKNKLYRKYAKLAFLRSKIFSEEDMLNSYSALFKKLV